MHKYICRTLIVLNFCSSAAFAGTHQIDGPTTVSDSNVLHAIFDLSPWFDNFEGSLRKQNIFPRIVANLTSQLDQGENVSCNFKVDKNGELRDLELKASSNDSQLDAQLLSLIQSTTFSKIPNNLPTERGITVEFWKAGGKIHFWSRLDKATNSAKFELVDYLGAQVEHPWKTWKREMRYRNTSFQQLALE
ncbi:hypothetical protein BH10CYA1_BH10CYA1_36820 [soil metagenome]